MHPPPHFYRIEQNWSVGKIVFVLYKKNLGFSAGALYWREETKRIRDFLQRVSAAENLSFHEFEEFLKMNTLVKTNTRNPRVALLLSVPNWCELLRTLLCSRPTFSGELLNMSKLDNLCRGRANSSSAFQVEWGSLSCFLARACN